MVTPFRNEPIVNFQEPGHRDAMQAALKQVEGQLGRDYPLVIGGRRITTGEWNVSTNPADPDQVVGRVARAKPEHVQQAIEAAWEAFPSWSNTDPAARAWCLIKAGAIIRRRAYEFSAWLVYEASKSWTEAYADMAEAIDFLEYYGREMLRLKGDHPTVPYPGEANVLRYIPLGVGAVIAPWNFPLAIMGGMTVAAVVTGNTVVLKPASQAPVIAALFCQVLEEASVPAGVVNFLPGSGAEIGDLLVDHPLTRFVSFTGSKEVGLRIQQRAAVTHPGQKWLKRAVLEMGGKDAIIVDETADLDAAAEGVVASAFGYQGQKCSACSRLIVLRSVHDALMEKVIRRTRALKVGNPLDPEVTIGALIEDAALRKVRDYIAIGRGEGSVVFEGGAVPDKGHFVPPTIIDDVAPTARIAQEEIFGPVLAVIPVDTFDEALEAANGTEYGLTGSVYSRDRARLERARDEFHVGNLYFNRKCTGALVGVQPFGGFNMSGTDSKTGSEDYLQLFMQAKSIAERF
jgi:1-pyrroline-5-carboxylate dehydrogenase